jgi:4'-phosphopantetheinyl transferase
MAASDNKVTSRPPPESPAVDDETVHVWRIQLAGDGERAERLATLLSADERARAARFHFDRHRRHYIVGRASLRRILASYIALLPSQIVFHYGPQGKPELANNDGERSPLSFNLSHSGELALCAIARRPLGVDLEWLREVPDADLIAARFFTPAEVARQRASADRGAAFLRHWTRKEAVIKAVGVGLSVPLDTFDVSSPEKGPTVLGCSGGEHEVWHVVDLEAPAGYVAALALPMAPREIVRFDAAE